MSLKKNFIYNTVYQLFMILLPIITVPYVSRVLGPQGVGIYSYTGSYTQYFILLGTVGIALYGRRQIAYVKKNPDKLSQEFSNIYALQFITTTISTTVYLIIFVILNKDNKLLYLIQALTLIANIFDISWLFIGFEDMKSVVIRNSVTKIIGIILVFLFVKHANDVMLYALIMGGTSLIAQLIMWVNVSKIIKIKKPQLKKVIKHLKPALALFISQLAIQVYVLLDKTMLGFITDTYQVGLYENSQKTIKLILTLVTSLGVVMLPRMSTLYAEGNIEKFKEMIYKSFAFVNFMAFPMVLGLNVISDNFSIWFYGNEFSGIEILLKIGALILLAISWSNILGMQVMIPMNKEKDFTISVTMGAFVNFCLNLILISRFKAIGTTISSVLAEITVTLVQLYLLRNIIDVGKIIKTIYKPLISSIFMWVIVRLVSSIFISGVLCTIGQIITGGLVYILMMLIFKEEFLIEILYMIKERIKSRRKNYEKV